MKKIGILSHFGSFQEGYALHLGWLERAKLLQYFDQDFDFLVNKNSASDIYPNCKKVLKHISISKPFKERVKFFEQDYTKLLSEYNVVLTADIVYQRRGNFLAQNQALRKVIPKLKAHFFHWVHSAWVNRPPGLQYPETLRFMPMENSTLVYMNESEKAGVAQMFGVPVNDVACVYNPKDFRSFNNFHPLSWKITQELDIPNKNVVQILPLCSTRMDAKGIDAVIQVFAAFKRQGLSVALIIANANARAVQDAITVKKNFMISQGLQEGQDFLFTSSITNNYPLPRQAVADLFKVANLFAFASYREVSPNVLLEAKISGNLLVLSNRLPCLSEFGGPDAIYFDATAKTPGVQDDQAGDLQLVTYHNEEDYFDGLAKQIMERVPSRKHLWEFSFENIWHKQLKPLLYPES